MSSTSLPKYVLTLDRVLDAPLANVWRCWTESALMEQWFCPKPWSVSDVRLDMRPGGECFFVMHGPNGERFENPGVFLAVERQRRIVTTDAFLPGWIPSERAFMVADVLMEDAETARRTTSRAPCTGAKRRCASTSRWASTKAGARPPISSKSSQSL